MYMFDTLQSLMARLESGKPKDTSNVSIIPLAEEHGRTKLHERLAASGGNAEVIVHPFFSERYARSRSPKAQARYGEYVSILKKTIERYSELDLPIILLEEESELADLTTELSRMGLKKGEVFLVPTKEATPEPTDKELLALGQELSDLGLRRSVASGSYLWKSEKSSGHPGCLGYTVDRFAEAGIDMTFGRSVYPGKDESYLAEEYPGKNYSL